MAYREIISKIFNYNDTLSVEDYKNISKGFQKADNFAGVISVGYIAFIESYILWRTP